MMTVCIQVHVASLAILYTSYLTGKSLLTYLMLPQFKEEKPFLFSGLALTFEIANIACLLFG